MKNLKIILSAIVLIFSVNAFSQQSSVIDSLLTLIKKDKADTNKVVHLYNLCGKYTDIGFYDSALYYGNAALQLAQHLNFKKGIARSYGSIGIIHGEQGNYPKELDYYLKALKVDEELNNKKGISQHLGNIGTVYKNQGDYTKALDYYFKALKISEDIENKKYITSFLINIGIVYRNKADYPKALDHYFKALKMNEELGNKSLKASILHNIGAVYSDQGDKNKALDCYLKALKINEELGYQKKIAIQLGNIGSVYTKIGKFKEAEQYIKRAISINDSIGAMNYLMSGEESLSELYDTTGRHKLALLHYKKSVALKDTIFSQENKKQLVQKEMNFEFEKKETATKAEQDKKDAVAMAEKSKQQFVLLLVSCILLLVFLFAGFIFRSLRVTKKQKLVIEQQKQIVEEHQKEIISSITYAKRLQEAILPPIPSIKKQFPESFILYNPKDVVAGDFYWMEIMDNIQFIAAADCTGHGVPGAMMSVVCSNALNRAVKEFGLRDTGTILDKVTDLVLETFEKSDSNVKDGMDISILAYNKGNNQIQWSGANNPLWYIQNGNMFEIKADKQPIGLCDNRKPFTTQHITYSENSIFYLFTDGYADQFGGEKGKKFMYKRFKDNLTAISNLPLSEQEKVLQTEFNGWKGGLEQVDDVTVLGIMI